MECIVRVRRVWEFIDGDAERVGPSAMNVTVDSTTNRVNGWTFDANGNVTAMPGGILAGVYDIENRLLEASKNATMTYGYGADDRRIYEVKRAAVFTNGDTIEEYVTWWPGQQRVGRYKVRWNSEMPNNGQPNSFVFARVEMENVWFGSKPLRLGAETNVAVDRLGSVRRSGRDYFQYGQEAPSTTTGGKEKYGTYRHDGETDLSYADQRYYATGAGRFMTADPYKASAGASEPGSWNRYAFVEADPVNYSDPTGMVKCQTVSASAPGGVAEVHCTTGLGTFIHRNDIPFAGDPNSQKDWDNAASQAEQGWAGQYEKEETYAAIAPIASLARKAFSNPDCAKLFSGKDVITATAALDSLWDRIQISFGEINTLIGPPRFSETSGEGFSLGFKSDFPYVGGYYKKANIKFSGGLWTAADTRERLGGFIHEMGHAITLLSVGTITGGFTHSDFSPGANLQNERLITANCVNPVLEQ